VNKRDTAEWMFLILIGIVLLLVGFALASEDAHTAIPTIVQR